MLDTEVTQELATEGVARDLVRAVQQARRDAGLHVSDRISLDDPGGTPEVFEATVTHRDLLVAETPGHTVLVGGADHPLTNGRGTTVSVGDGYGATIVVDKA